MTTIFSGVMSTSHSNATLAPVAPSERIDGLDVLRGWAMFGVLWSNLNGDYISVEPVSSLDHKLAWMQDWLIQDHFYSLLIILFGVGFGIQLLRATERGIDVRNTYYRRSAALLAIGVVHGTLIWHGDILTIYALVSFALVLFRNSSNRRLIVAAILLWIVGQPLVRDIMILSGFREMIRAGGHAGTFGTATWMQIEHMRLIHYTDWLGRWALTSFPTILASFLVGMWSIKTGLFRRVVQEPRMTMRLLGITLIATGVGFLCDMYSRAWWPVPQAPAGYAPAFPYPYLQLNMLRQMVLRFFQWTTEGETIAYACIVLLVWQRPFGARVLRPLANAGRMALTTYLTQSVVCTLLFYSYGFRWWGKVNYTGMLEITLVLFTVQMAFSTWWLGRYKFGPAEWVWRTLTYGKRPEMRV